MALGTGVARASEPPTRATTPPGPDRSILSALHNSLLNGAAVVTILAAGVHWGLLVSAGAYLAAHLVVAAIGVERVLYVTSVVNLILFVNLYVLLARGRYRAPEE